jgi:ribosomal-protein-alanine N-acetyltransferase
MPDAALMTTTRFTVREFREQDRAAFIACQLDPVFSRHHLESERGVKHASAVFDLFLAWKIDDPRQNHQYVIAPRDLPDAYVGNVGVRTRGLKKGQAELGIELIPSCWGKGAATEIIEAVLPWAMDTLNVESFVAETAIDNWAARRLAETAGLRLHRLGDKCIWSSG